MPSIWPFGNNETKNEAHITKPNLTSITTELRQLPQSTLILGGVTGSLLLYAAGSAVYKRFGRRIQNSAWITPQILERGRWLRGVAVSVGDGDNFRFFHTPPLSGYRWPFKFRSRPVGRDLKDQTIHIRLSAVDAPELGHFGKSPQPYATDSLEWLRSTILHKPVYVKLLRKDQYARIVGEVRLPPRILPSALFRGKCVSEEMVKAGWAVVYEQAGAEYGKLGKEGYELLQKRAQASKVGMWQSKKALESPAEYKKRHAASSIEGTAGTAPSVLTREKPKKGWFSRLFKK